VTELLKCIFCPHILSYERGTTCCADFIYYYCTD